MTLPDIVPPEQAKRLSDSIHPAPLLNDRPEVQSRERPVAPRRRNRSMSRDPLDELLGIGDYGDDVEDDFIIDDDDGGYAEPKPNGKRSYELLEDQYSGAKRRAYDTWTPQIHESFQPGSTPWRGGRRYLCENQESILHISILTATPALNLIGFVWTVDQQTHNTVTVEFYDRDLYRDFHFTDPYLYDHACLSECPTIYIFLSLLLIM